VVGKNEKNVGIVVISSFFKIIRFPPHIFPCYLINQFSSLLYFLLIPSGKQEYTAQSSEGFGGIQLF